ncbi:hypothetical protein RIF29_21316 [Crotalaria pallida]|uniref:Uncharacterized protein n=1 Tax=Crotalaria pallida TaxID=3830 RepID=A0AAN9I8A7_CROPI
MILRGCKGSPLALELSGRSLNHQDKMFWHNWARGLSTGHTVLDYNADLLSCLQKSFDILDPKTIECFKDLSLFPEDQRIPAAALVDMWAELLGDDDASAMERIYQLVNLNMADIIVTRKVANGALDYNHHYVTQYGLLRDLAIHQTNEEPVAERNRLIIDLSCLPKWWAEVNEHPIKARILSLSVDEAFTSDWSFFQPTEVEVLVLNLKFQAKKFTLPLPVFMKKMSTLKVLIIANYDIYHADLENVELFHYLSDLKRIRLQRVSVPFLGKIGVQLKNLQKLSLFMCIVDEAFINSEVQISDMMPNLVEIDIDDCDMVELPDGISNIVSLRKLSITKCRELSALPDAIENLVNLESLRLSSSTGLKVLPDSVAGLRNLKLLDISGCISLNNLPENIGELSKLEKLNVKGCSGLSELPTSVMDLGSLRHVVCDEETSELWELFTSSFSDLRLEVVQADDNTKWLGY